LFLEAALSDLRLAGHTERIRLSIVHRKLSVAGFPMPASPAVSVVMTVFNTARYIDLAVESVLSQSFSDFEFIIVDDGSTDGSLEILNRYVERHPRIRLVSRPHAGIVHAANEGIGLARGKYIARMDSDDVSVPTRFATQVQYLESHPECVLLGTRVIIIDPYASPVAESGQKLTHEEIEAELLTGGGGWAVVQPSTMMRTNAVRVVGGYRGMINMSEDHDLFLRLAERGRVANLAEPLLWYRRHSKSVSYTQYSQSWEVKERMLREAYARRGLPIPAGWKYEPWRPPRLVEQIRLWGWAAIKAGNLKVARKHAFAALRLTPFSSEAWNLVYCAIRGR
jgi:glycosyltransferase involved in cell wall biosynthesis